MKFREVKQKMIGYTTFAFFALYFGITFVLYHLFPQKAKWCVLLLGSYVFYFISCKGHIWQIIAATVIIWLVGMWLQKLNDAFKAKKKGLPRDEKKVLKKKYTSYKRGVLALGVLSTLGILLACKYHGFFIDTANHFFGTNARYLKVVQPLGISFYTLSAIGYITDVYHGKFEAEKNPFRVSLFLSFMLTIVEGPITRYDQFGVQLKFCPKFDYHGFIYGAVRVVWGLIKKMIIADRAAMFVNVVFDKPNHWNAITVIPAVLFYTLQLYSEFSGIMDVMCGLGEMMGLHLPENFRRPFFAKTINEFWQRWHITLGGWLRDYVFYPISLSKAFMSLSKSASKKFNRYYANLIPTAVALFFVWFSNGFWHGSGWKYIVYGLYYYVLMMIGMFFEPLFRKICPALKINRQSKGFRLFQIARTFVIVNFGMFIFRADDLKSLGKMISSIFTNPIVFDGTSKALGLKSGLDLVDIAIIALGALLMLIVGIIQEKGTDIREKIAKLPYFIKFVLFMVMIFAVILMGAYGEGYGVIDLIYAKF